MHLSSGNLVVECPSFQYSNMQVSLADIPLVVESKFVAHVAEPAAGHMEPGHMILGACQLEMIARKLAETLPFDILHVPSVECRQL